MSCSSVVRSVNASSWLPFQEVGPLHDHEHVVLAGGKAPVDRLVAVELLRVGAEQLRQRVIDLQLGDADGRQHGDHRHEHCDDIGRLEGEKPQPLQAEREHECPARLLSAAHRSPLGTLRALTAAAGRSSFLARKLAPFHTESAPTRRIVAFGAQPVQGRAREPASAAIWPQRAASLARRPRADPEY